MLIYQIYDRLSPRHKWNLVVHTDDPAHAQRCKVAQMRRWWNYSTSGAAQVAERVIEVESYQSGDDSLPASAKLDNLWRKDHGNALGMLEAAAAALSPVVRLPVDNRPIGQRV